MQGMHEGFDEKLARQRLQLQQRLNDAQIAHDAALTHHEILQTEFDQETRPDRKRLLASQADEAAIKVQQAQTQLDVTKQAALEMGFHPSEMFQAPGTAPTAAAKPDQLFFPHPDTVKTAPELADAFNKGTPEQQAGMAQFLPGAFVTADKLPPPPQSIFQWQIGQLKNSVPNLSPDESARFDAAAREAEQESRMNIAHGSGITYKPAVEAIQNIIKERRESRNLTVETLMGPDGKSHRYQINQQGQRVHDLGIAPPPQVNQTTIEGAAEKPVLAYDSTDKAYLTNRADAKSRGLTGITEATPKQIDDSRTHTAVLNDMQQKLNDVVAARSALNQNTTQRGVIAKALAPTKDGSIEALVNAAVLSEATEQTKEYVQSVLSLRESGLGLPKELTGGSRVTEIQTSALWQTLPSGASLNGEYALGQAKKFQANIDRLRKRVPEVRGMEAIAPAPELTGNKPGASTTAPGKDGISFTPIS